MEMGISKLWYIIALPLIGTFAQSENTYKLSYNTIPSRYEIHLTTNLVKYTFKGTVHITVTCLNATDTIVLNSKGLDIDTKNITIAEYKDKIIPNTKASLNTHTNCLQITSAEKLESGKKYVLSISFNGKSNDMSSGYIIRSYFDQETNKTKLISFTTFEPNAAQTMFPCFEDPAIKANFKIYLSHEKGYTSASNTKLINMTPMPSNSEYVTCEFEESNKMSTFTVAFLISDMSYLELKNVVEGVNFRIIVRQNAVNQINLAKNTVPLLLKFYEKYFGNNFPINKMDLVALPNELLDGTENDLGLVFYNEESLLVDLETAKSVDIALVIQELGHDFSLEWYGDCTTFITWSDYWFFDGLATYLAAFGVDHIHSDWNYIELVIDENLHVILNADSLASSHPVSMIINDPSESPIFDDYTSMKGAGIIHMINSFLGKEIFQNSLMQFYNKYKFSNGKLDNLWSILTNEAHKANSLDNNVTVHEILYSWIHKAGYPVVMFNRDRNSNTVTMSQVRFFSDGTTESKETFWWIPITMATSLEPNFNQTKPILWLNHKTNNTSIQLKEGVEWYIVNVQTTVMCRVLYDEHNWMSIVYILRNPNKYKMIHTLNRARIISDSAIFARLGILDYNTTLSIIKYLKHEKNYPPWNAAIKSLDPIAILLRKYPEHRNVFQEFMRDTLQPLYDDFRDIKVIPTGYESTIIKGLALYHAGLYMIQDCLKKSLNIFQEWMKSPYPNRQHEIVPKEYAFSVSCNAIKSSIDTTEWNFLYARYLEANVEATKYDYLKALCCSLHNKTLHRLLDITIQNNNIISNNYAYEVFNYVAFYNEIGNEVAKQFLYQRIGDIYEYFNNDSSIIGMYVNSVGTQITTKIELNEFQQFLDKNAKYLKGTEVIQKQTLRNINENIEWIKNYADKIFHYLKKD